MGTGRGIPRNLLNGDRFGYGGGMESWDGDGIVIPGLYPTRCHPYSGMENQLFSHICLDWMYLCWIQTSASSTDEVQLEINSNVEIDRAFIYFSHVEASWMGIIKISSVWTGLEVAGLKIADHEQHYKDKVVEAIVKLRTPVWCRPKALRCLSQLQVVSGTSEVCLPSAGEKAWLPWC
ncbi:hypothetical protein L3X38_001501 [Prunus dulcis]|uniref:Uncharacterized protein n=1 Tax=Prunus dulcis TaxID=3755 RepID=A0AAD4WS75_PRUDU|nr:hypothetical protein L3X38_001501 [Prunus dulcis]